MPVTDDMGHCMKSYKNILGIIGFSAVIAMSFFIISDVEKTLTLWQSTGLVATIYEPVSAVQISPPALRPSVSQPYAAAELFPRVTVLSAEGYFAMKGYPYTAFVEFGQGALNFHLASDVDIGYAQLAIASIMEVFDAAYEFFPDRHFSDFFFVADSGNIPERRVNYRFAATPDKGVLAYLYFLGPYPIPMWLALGLENYLMAGDGAPLSNECLIIWLQQDTGAPPGDAWLFSALGPCDITRNDVLSAAYTFVRRWSHAGELYDIVRLAQTNARTFAGTFADYIIELTGDSAVSDAFFLYRFGDFKVMTEHGSYIFIGEDYVWTWARVTSFVEYMDAAIEYVSYRFPVGYSDNIRVTLYPFGVSSIPDAIAYMADAFDWDATDVNFVANDKITLASTARLGPWAMSHEVVHILLFRAFPGHRPATWMLEGMAVLGELMFRDAFQGARPYRFNVPQLSNIDTMSRGGNGHILPFFCGEDTFGRESWTYDDAGSFVLYLYNNFGIEALLEMYISDNYSQFDMAIEIFGRELSELMYSWREFLWPNGEPVGWWSR